MTPFNSLLAVGALFLAACGGEGADVPSDSNGELPVGGAGAGGSGDGPAPQPPAECWPLSGDTPVYLLKEGHSARVEPMEQLDLEETPGISIRMLGTMVASEARLGVQFERCLDLSRFQHLAFSMEGISGPLEMALNVPTNSPPPRGTCVGQRCYAPRVAVFLESGSSSAQARWADFQNGSPGAIADPYHVIGLTWIKHGSPGDPVDLTVSSLRATTLD